MQHIELQIRDYLSIVRRRIWTILLCLALVIAFTIFYTNRQVPTYQTSVTVKIEQRVTFTGLMSEYFSYNPGDAIATEQSMITSQRILEQVCRRLGVIDEKSSTNETINAVNRIKGMIATEKEGDGNIIRLKVVSNNPSEAVAVANILAEVYKEISFEDRNRETMDARSFIKEQLDVVTLNLRKSEEDLKKFKESGRGGTTQRLLSDKLSGMKIELAGLLDKYTENHPAVKNLRREIENLEKKLGDVPASETALARLERELQVNEETYKLLNQKYKEALITEAQKFNPVTILNQAAEPSKPLTPNKLLNTIVGVVIGLMLGFIFASITESLDTSIGTIEEVEEYLKISVIGLVPHIQIDEKRFKNMKPEEERKARLQSKLVLQYDPKSQFAEAYRMLQTNIKISHLKEKANKVLLFTSATAHEGKTITCANFALACAQTGLSVLLMDLDLRKPELHHIFGLKKDPGLIDIITGNARSEDCLRGVSDFLVGGMDADTLQRNSGIENLKLLTTGFLPPNPLSILDSRELTEFIRDMKGIFDMIVIDSPPVLPVADTTVLGSKVDAVILVYKAGSTARGALKRASTQITNANGNVLGVVLNDIKIGELELGHPYYYYYRAYGKEEKGFFAKVKEIFKKKKKKK